MIPVTEVAAPSVAHHHHRRHQLQQHIGRCHRLCRSAEELETIITKVLPSP